MDVNRESRSKRTSAVAYIQENCKKLVVTLSGGVDSAVLLEIAAEALGKDAVAAVTGRSQSMTDADLDDARGVAEYLGCAHHVLDTCEMDIPMYRANAGDRCYHCRGELFRVARAWAGEHRFDGVAYGAIVDDLGDYRPGMEAAREQAVLAPLLEAGMNKEDVRALAASRSLPVREKPANPCLASRIPVGVEVTPERLGQVGAAESALHALGFGQLRVRHHGEIARLEMDEEGSRLMEERTVREAAVKAVRAAGFRFVTLDLEGYRTGSLNPERE